MTAPRARLMALAAAVLFSTGGAAIKTEAFSAAQVSCIRSGIAALVLVLWVRDAFGMRPERIPNASRLVWGIAAAYATVLTLFVVTTKLTTAANAIFLQSTAPLYMLALSPWLLGEPIRRRDGFYMAALATGLLLCFAGQPAATAIASNPALGNALAAIDGIAWAFTLIGLRWAQRDGSDIGIPAVILGNALACVVALPFAWPFPDAPAVEWGALIYLGVVQIALAYVCLTAAMRKLPALEVSLLLLLEPVLNPMWTWLVRGEQPGRWVMVGGTVIIAATAAQSIIASRD